MIVRGMKGLGDNIYQRAFVKRLQGPVYLETPWPELYEDLPGVKFVKAETPLRTQAKNMALQQDARWENPPRGSVVTVQYGTAGIVTGMRRCFGVAPGSFDLPDFGPSPVSGRYIVVRPATVRAEWIAEARNPLTMYIAEAAEAARAAGYRVISVADLEAGKEWAVGKLPPADEIYHAGEFNVRQLMAFPPVASRTNTACRIADLLHSAGAGRLDPNLVSFVQVFQLERLQAKTVDAVFTITAVAPIRADHRPKILHLSIAHRDEQCAFAIDHRSGHPKAVCTLLTVFTLSAGLAVLPIRPILAMDDRDGLHGLVNHLLDGLHVAILAVAAIGAILAGQGARQLCELGFQARYLVLERLHGLDDRVAHGLAEQFRVKRHR